MKHTVLLCAVLLFSAACCKAQLNMFALLKANDSLGANAHSIIQYSRSEFTVSDVDKAVLKVRTVVTALDKQGEAALQFTQFSSSFVKLDDVTITLYNSLGLVSKTYTKKDLSQHTSGEGMVTEGMYYYKSFESTAYPATMQVEYTLRFKGTIGYPSFNIQYPGQAIRQSEHVITVPKDLDLRYKNQFTNIVPVKTEDKDNFTYTWKVENIPAIPFEEGIGGRHGKYPAVLIAPNKIKLDNYAGDFKTWAEFGRWDAEVNKGTLNLSPQQKDEIRTLAAGATTPVEKARVLYEHLQNNFRYVSIQLGIGGFRSFTAAETHRNRYGDCKALTKYMQACLDAVGIKSYQALVNSGANEAPVNEDFTIDLFDHVILCVPFENDTTWLECTSPITNYGIPGNFTENRNALLITDDGGVLVHTPASRFQHNRFSVKSVVTLNEDGGGDVESTLYTTGEYREYYLYTLYDESADDQKTVLLSRFELPAPDKFSVSLPDRKHDTLIRANVNASFEKIASFKAGSKMFLNASWQKVFSGYLPKKTERRLDYYFDFPFENTDTTVYRLPKGYTVESMPKSMTRSFKYGDYSITVKYDKATNEVTTVSVIKLVQQQIPAAEYGDMKNFFGLSLANESEKIIIKPE